MKGGVFFNLFDKELSQVEALDIFIKNSDVSLLTNSSLYGVILKLTLKSDVESPIHMLTRATFINAIEERKSLKDVKPEHCELRDLIVKLVVTRDAPGEISWQSNPTKLTSNKTDFFSEIHVQQELAIKTGSQLDPITPFIGWAQVYDKDQGNTFLNNLSRTTNAKTLAIDKLKKYLTETRDSTIELGVIFMQSVKDSMTMAKALTEPSDQIIFGSFKYTSEATTYSITYDRGILNYARLLLLRAGAMGVGHLDFHMGNIVVSPADEKILYRFDDLDTDPGCEPQRGTHVGGGPTPTAPPLEMCNTYTKGRMFLLDWGRCIQVDPMYQDLAYRLTTMFISAHTWARTGNRGWKWPVEEGGLDQIYTDVMTYFTYLQNELQSRYIGFERPTPPQYLWVTNFDKYDVAIMLQLARNMNFTIATTDRPIDFGNFFQGQSFPFQESFFRTHMFSLTSDIREGRGSPPGTMYQLGTEKRVLTPDAPAPEIEVQPVLVNLSGVRPVVEYESITLEEVIPVISVRPAGSVKTVGRTAIRVQKPGKLKFERSPQPVIVGGRRRKTRRSRTRARKTRRKH